MNLEWWILPQMNQTIVRTRERAHTFMMMCLNYLPPDSEELALSRELFEMSNKLYVLINERIVEQEVTGNGK